MSSETDVQHQQEYLQQDDKTSLFSTLKGAFFKAIFVLGSAFLVFESTRNSLTYHVGKLWGGVGDVWQELWEKVLSVTGKRTVQWSEIEISIRKFYEVNRELYDELKSKNTVVIK
jgi:hypothetical protein